MRLKGVTHRYLALEDESTLVVDWFRSQRPAPVEHAEAHHSLFYFREFGPLGDDATKSPVVNVFMPTRKRGVLITCGEVHFLATPISLFPGLQAVNRRFRTWLSEFTCVFSRRKDFVPEWNYYLEGAIQNFDSDVFALPNAMDALRHGAYFVSQSDTDGRIDQIASQLQLRGVEGILPV